MMMHRSFLSLLCLVLFLWLDVATAASDVDNFCDYPVLPTDLDLITSIEATNHREVHLHGQYRIGLDAYLPASRWQAHNLSLFFASQPHYVRLSLLPFECQELEVQLWNTRTNQMVTCAMEGGGDEVERMVFAELAPQTPYKVLVKYNVAWSWRASKCPSVRMELAVQPKKSATTFHEACLAASSEGPHLPVIMPSPTEEYYFHAASMNGAEGRPTWVQLSSSPTSSSSTFRVLSAYSVLVPAIPGRSQPFKFQASLQARFLDGGALVLMLTSGTLSVPPTIQECAASSTLCIYGERSIRNHMTVQGLLWPGEKVDTPMEYRLWLLQYPVGAAGDNSAAVVSPSSCAPVSLDVKLVPLPEPESYISCSTDPLPASFNVPGLYDNLTGTMIYSQNVLVNLSTRVQDVTLAPTVHRSLFRAYIGNHDTLDIDLMLFQRPLVAPSRGVDPETLWTSAGASLSINGPEGLVYELDQKNLYKLRVSVPYPHRQFRAQDDHDFAQHCDSYFLAVSVFPLSVKSDPASNEKATETGNCDATLHPKGFAPDFRGLGLVLNESRHYEFGLPSLEEFPFSYRMDATSKVQQNVILSIPFYVPAPPTDDDASGSHPLKLVVLIASDLFSGTVDVRLNDDETYVAYGVRRATGTSLTADLEEGWYTLSVLSPYVQMTGKTWKEIIPSLGPAGDSLASEGERRFPLCLRYNINLRITARDSCVTALPLPEEYPNTPHHHRHVSDVYDIPYDGRQFMTITPRVDSLFHLLISESDYRPSVFVLKGGLADLPTNQPPPPPGRVPTQGESGSDSVEHHDVNPSTNVRDVLRRAAISVALPQFPNGGGYELLLRLEAEQTYTVFFDFTEEAETVGGVWSYFCATFTVEMSMSKINALDAEDKVCNVYKDFPTKRTLDEVSLPYMEGPTPYTFRPLAPKDNSGAKKRSAFQKWYTTFTVRQSALFRANFEYEFTHHGFSLLLCSCDVNTKECGNCQNAKNYRNGLEIPLTLLSPGEYVVMLRPWQFGVSGVVSSDSATKHRRKAQNELDQLVNVCTYGTFQMAIVAETNRNNHGADGSPKDSQALCPSTMQYLPGSLNNVAFLSPLYNDEMHAQLLLLLNRQHEEDATVLTVKEDTILRAFAPSGAITIAMSVKCVDDSACDVPNTPFKTVTAFNNFPAIHTKLPPGTYELRLHFYFGRNSFSAGSSLSSNTCPAIPFELSLMTVEDVQNLYSSSSISQLCQDGVDDRFPTVPFFHGHDTLYRNPAKPFDKTISFTIGELGGSIEADVRYNFETSGLAASLTGVSLGADGSPQTTVYSWRYYPDRTVLTTDLPLGRYALRIYDPVDASVYSKVPSATCVPYSLHLRTVNRGNYSDFTNAPSSSGTTTTTPAPTNHNGVEELTCAAMHIDTFPQQLDAKGAASLVYSSSMLSIPFDQGVPARPSSGAVKLMKTSRTVRFRVAPNSIVRAWARSQARAMLQLQLFQVSGFGGSNTLLTSGEFFGYHTQSLHYKVRSTSSNNNNDNDDGTVTVALTVNFFFSDPPAYREDYTTCDGKKQLTTFELYVASFPLSAEERQTRCEDADSEMPDGDGPAEGRLPPASLTFTGTDNTVFFAKYFVTNNVDELAHNSGSAVDGDDAVEGLTPSEKKRGETSSLARLGQVLSNSGKPGSIPGVSGELQMAVHTVLKTTLVIPPHAEGITLISHVKYNLNLMNLRTAIFRAKDLQQMSSGTSDAMAEPIVEGFGTPIGARGAHNLNAESMIRVSNTTVLVPGESYTFVIMIAHAVKYEARQIYCTPIHCMFDMQAATLHATPAPPNAPSWTSPPPTAPAAALVDFYPRSLTDMDISDSLKVVFQFNRAIAPRLSVTNRFAILQNENGRQVYPNGQYFEDSTTFVALFAPLSLEWAQSYRLVLNRNALSVLLPNSAAAADATFSLDAVLGSREVVYSTGYCGCNLGMCVQGGGCRCQEPGGDVCTACAEGLALSKELRTVGSGARAKRMRVCEPSTETTHSPRGPATPSSPTPTTKPTLAPSSGPHTPPSPTLDDGHNHPPQSTTDPNATPPSSTTTSAPFQWPRYALGVACLLTLVLYTTTFFVKHRSAAQRSLLHRNPFQQMRGAGTGLDDDEDEEEEVGAAGDHHHAARHGEVELDFEDEMTAHNEPTIK